jgi:spermidine/putrescine transport system permease protein
MLKTIIILLPFVLIAVFWAMAARERRLANDPSRKSFFQRNGAVISTYLLVAVAFWAIMMIVLPQLYMVDYSFHPKLAGRRMSTPSRTTASSSTARRSATRSAGTSRISPPSG